MHFTELQLISVLAQEMNMRKASERLFVSQPALSQRLQSIEKEWNTKLFIRSQKGLTLTPAGELVVAYAEETMKREEQIKEEIQSLASQVHGTLKIACASIVGQNWLPKVLKRYVEKYPQAKISLMTGWSSEIVKALYEGEVHVGIVRGSTDWKGRKIHLFKDPLFLVDREIKNMNEALQSERPFIQFKSDSTYFQEIQDWWHRHFQTYPKRTIIVDQIETCKQMTFNGIGYAILPSITLQGNEKNIFKIPLVDEKQDGIQRDTWLVGYESAFELNQVQAFNETVAEYLAENHPNQDELPNL